MVLAFDNFKYMPRFDNTVDFSGVSCFKYSELISVADTLHCLRKYLTGYDVKTGSFKYPKFLPETFKSDTRKKITSRIHAIRDSFITNVSNRFQQNNVELWNPESKLSTKIIVPPVTPYDEVTNIGMGTSLVHLLELSGILVRIERHKDDIRWKLCDNWEERKILLALDGLSINRLEGVRNKLLNMTMSFTDMYEQNIILQKGLSRIIHISGQLHMAFHMLQSIYTIFDNLLNLVQKCLKWKKLTPKKVSESYNLCKSMLFLTIEEVERLLIDRFIHENSAVLSKTLRKIDCEKVFAIKFSIDFRKYILRKSNETTDERMKYLLNFYIISREFRLYDQAMKSGDALELERIENSFLGIFMLLDKNTYSKICMEQMEMKYSDIDYKTLHEIRLNSSFRYRENSEKASTYHPLHVLDEVMENINKHTKTLLLGNTEDSWVHHSSNVVYARKAIQYIQQTYRYGRIDFENVIDELSMSNLKPKKQVNPSKITERIRVYEFMTKMFGEEKNDRKLINADTVKLIESLDTKLTKVDDKEEDDILQQSVSKIMNNPDYIEEEHSDSCVIVDETYRHIEHQCTTHCDMHPSTQTSQCHRLALIDLFTMAHNKIISSNICSFRMRIKERKLRENAFIREVYCKEIKRLQAVNEVSRKLLDLEKMTSMQYEFRRLYRSQSKDLITIATNAMLEIWGKSPRSFQIPVIKKILKMKYRDESCESILLVQGTGSGKSSVPQTIGVVDGGVTIIIENTLSLSADQMSKIDAASNKHKFIQSFQTDNLSKPESVQVAKFLLALPVNTDISVFLFSSPESLLSDLWKKNNKTTHRKRINKIDLYRRGALVCSVWYNIQSWF